MTITASDFELPSNIQTLKDYQKAQTAPKFYDDGEDVNDEMGQQEFLLLFTTQLQNQNPLDPMKNEEFVAQLAQFSQLEATTSMAQSLEGLTGSLQKERMLTGASLIGKKVQAPTGPAMLENGIPISGVLELDKNAGAESVILNVYDKAGQLVRSINYGRQAPGDFTAKWDGKDNSGDKMPDGQYSLVASVRGYDGSNIQAPISTPSTIVSVTYNAAFDDLILEVANGATVNLSQVKRIEGGSILNSQFVPTSEQVRQQELSTNENSVNDESSSSNTEDKNS
jgi:flagellar basal-body rod modification protein FlgD